MLVPKLTEPTPVISVTDPALRQIPKTIVAKYAMSRKIADLGDLAALPEQPTIFSVLPLLVAHEAEATIGTPSSARAIVREHVCGVVGAPWLATEKTSDGRTRLTAAAVDLLPLEIIMEIFRVVIELQRGGEADAFFTPPGSFSARADLEMRRRSLAEIA
jgi:hypothetical protein